MRHAFALGLTAVASLGLAAPAVGAQTSTRAGWWTVSPVAVAPDVPAGGLLVQGGPDAATPVAYAAVAYALPRGTSPQTLLLAVADGSASTAGATLAVCPLTEAFTPAEGGAIDDAPSFDCATRATAAPTADGSGYAFDLSSLATDGDLAVAVLPTAPTDRVALEPPGVDAVDVRDTTVPLGAAPGADAGSDPVAGAAATTPDAPAPFDPFELAGPVDLPPAATAAPAPSAAAPAVDTPAAAPATAVAATPAPSSRDRSRVAPLVFVALAVVAAALWLTAGRGHEPEIA